MTDPRTRNNTKERLATFQLVVFLSLAVPAPLAAETLTCTPTQKFICSSQGCKTVPAKVRALIDIDKHTYSRCDSIGCDKYIANMSTGGIYLYVSVPDKSLGAKVEFPSLLYFETVSAGLTVYMSFGRCTRK